MRKMSEEELNHAEFLDDTIAEVVETLQNTEVKKALGVYAAKLYAIAEGLYIPNIRDGVISIPVEYRDTDRIPIFAPLVEQKLKIDKSCIPMGPAQQKNLLNIATNDGVSCLPNIDLNTLNNGLLAEFIHRADDSLPETRLGMIVMGSLDVDSATAEPLRAKGFPEGFIVYGKPIVLLAIRNDLSQFTRNSVLIHELEHVNQFETLPIISKSKYEDERFRLEVEALHVQVRYDSSLDLGHNADKRSPLINLEVEALRILYAKDDDPFGPNPEFLEALRKAGLLRAIQLSYGKSSQT
jgi:hypothetical protein